MKKRKGMEIMKHFQNAETDDIIIIGKTEEIRDLYNQLAEAGELIPLYADAPIFSEKKLAYAVYVEGHYFSVGSSDAALADISGESWKQIDKIDL